ncbi:unnamed protein product [Microthlaspi erraticum]|uniref:Uncharacterized protein n=1 Tax=Microthlaspi erraticum TaxID=1685480 RepID=A0A6D2LE36_9BRAS|nr:unnamed protein product [Microthlaspi erraticum]
MSVWQRSKARERFGVSRDPIAPRWALAYVNMNLTCSGWILEQDIGPHKLIQSSPAHGKFSFFWFLPRRLLPMNTCFYPLQKGVHDLCLGLSIRERRRRAAPPWRKKE